MPSTRLTDIAVRNLKPVQGRQYEVWDSNISGLGLRVSPKGSKSWVLVYRIGGRSRRLTLGRYPAIGVAAAREKAFQATRSIARGTDPAYEKQQERRDPNGFDEIVDTFIETYAKKQNRSWSQAEQILRRTFVRFWKKRDIRQIKKRDVTDRIDRILAERGPSSAVQAFALIRKLFNWCVERGILETSPCQGLKSPAKPRSRDRVLSDDELTRVWRAAVTVGYPFGTFVHLLILTAQRRGEVASMRWEDLDLDNGIWSLPRESTKADRAHVIPLAPLAVELLNSIPRLSEIWVFTAQGKNRPMNGFNKRKANIEELSGTSGWTLHDLRRTAATGMAQQKVPPHVIERILNHTSGTFGGVAGIYNRFGYLDEMRDALEAWSSHVFELANAHCES